MLAAARLKFAHSYTNRSRDKVHKRLKKYQNFRCLSVLEMSGTTPLHKEHVKI